MATRPVGYVLKMYPRFSETFILNELLELERQGAQVRIFSLWSPDVGVFHADVARVRARVTYVPTVALRNALSFVEPHARLLASRPARYARAVLRMLGRATPLRTFARAGYVADCVRRERIAHVHAHFASAPTSVALEVSRLVGVPYSFTAHAKDIYIESVRQDDLSEKLRHARFVSPSATTTAATSRASTAERGWCGCTKGSISSATGRSAPRATSRRSCSRSEG